MLFSRCHLIPTPDDVPSAVLFLRRPRGPCCAVESRGCFGVRIRCQSGTPETPGDGRASQGSQGSSTTLIAGDGGDGCADCQEIAHPRPPGQTLRQGKRRAPKRRRRRVAGQRQTSQAERRLEPRFRTTRFHVPHRPPPSRWCFLFYRAVPWAASLHTAQCAGRPLSTPPGGYRRDRNARESYALISAGILHCTMRLIMPRLRDDGRHQYCTSTEAFGFGSPADGRRGP